VHLVYKIESSTIENQKMQKLFSSTLKKSIVFSGIQPTGQLHLGNYLGAVHNWVNMIHNNTYHEKMFCLVDMHAITVLKASSTTTTTTTENYHLNHTQSILQLASTLIACGLDPEKCQIYVQSHVPQHAELMWILACHINESRLHRMHHYKDKKSKNNQNTSVGLLIYPTLMCSDILLYATRQDEDLYIPVGDDQRQHLELSQEVVHQMNARYTYQIFTSPHALYTPVGTRVKSLRDGTQKMSKSDPNEHSRINMIDTEDEIRQKIKKSKTDAIAGITYDPVNRPEVSNLIEIFAALSNQTNEQVVQQYHNTTNSKFKDELTQLLLSKIGTVGQEAKRLMQDPQYVTSVLHRGADYAQERTFPALEHVRKEMGFFGKRIY
jgi:tryptophanyl-tRNA synthetase